MKFPRERVKRVVEIPGGGRAPALPEGFRMEDTGMWHNKHRETTHVGYLAQLEDYPVESYEARAIAQAEEEYGMPVDRVESSVEGGVIEVEVASRWRHAGAR